MTISMIPVIFSPCEISRVMRPRPTEPCPMQLVFDSKPPCLTTSYALPPQFCRAIRHKGARLWCLRRYFAPERQVRGSLLLTSTHSHELHAMMTRRLVPVLIASRHIRCERQVASSQKPPSLIPPDAFVPASVLFFFFGFSCLAGSYLVR